MSKISVDLVLGVLSKLISMPKKGVKEGTLIGLFTIGSAIFDQYLAGGIAAIEPASVAGFVSVLWVLFVRLYQKYEESKS